MFASIRKTDVLFSNQGRFLKLLAALLLLAGLGAYAATASFWQCKSLGDCLTDARRCDGQELVVGPTRVTAVAPDGFTIHSSQGAFFFQGSFPGLTPGKYADIQALFHAPNRFEAMAVHIHMERKIKIWGSLAAAMIVAGLLLRVLWRKEF